MSTDEARIKSIIERETNKRLPRTDSVKSTIGIFVYFVQKYKVSPGQVAKAVRDEWRQLKQEEGRTGQDH